MNLVTNASDAIGGRDGVIRVSISRVKVDRDSGAISDRLADGDYVQLKVSDTGRGMSLETQAKVFDPFFTTKSAWGQVCSNHTTHGAYAFVCSGFNASFSGVFTGTAKASVGGTIVNWSVVGMQNLNSDCTAWSIVKPGGAASERSQTEFPRPTDVGEPNYGPRRAAYDLKELLGKAMVRRIGLSRPYEPLPEGLCDDCPCDSP
jgi:hypothetical protein